MLTFKYLPFAFLLFITSCQKPSENNYAVSDGDSISVDSSVLMPSDEVIRDKVVDVISKDDSFDGVEFQSEETAEGVFITLKGVVSDGWTVPFDGYFKGDLNNDGKEDVLVPVHVFHGNQEYEEYYLFLSTTAEYPFFAKYDSYDIVDDICNKKLMEYGRFYVSQINNGLVIGSSIYHGGDEAFYHDYSYMCETEKYKLNLETRKFELVSESPLLKRRNDSGDEVYDEVMP